MSLNGQQEYYKLSSLQYGKQVLNYNLNLKNLTKEEKGKIIQEIKKIKKSIKEIMEKIENIDNF